LTVTIKVPSETQGDQRKNDLNLIQGFWSTEFREPRKGAGEAINPVSNTFKWFEAHLINSRGQAQSGLLSLAKRSAASSPLTAKRLTTCSLCWMPSGHWQSMYRHGSVEVTTASSKHPTIRLDWMPQPFLILISASSKCQRDRSRKNRSS